MRNAERPRQCPARGTRCRKLDRRILELIDRKRHEPGEDLITDLIRAETEEGRLDKDEVLCIAVAVVMARNQLTRGLQLLAEHPHIWEQLVDDGPLGAAVEEILRFAPLAPIRRVLSEDLPVHDVEVAEGSVIMFDLGAANRDPKVVDDPDTFRIDREGRSQHFSLGHGHKVLPQRQPRQGRDGRGPASAPQPIPAAVG